MIIPSLANCTNRLCSFGLSIQIRFKFASMLSPTSQLSDHCRCSRVLSPSHGSVSAKPGQQRSWWAFLSNVQHSRLASQSVVLRVLCNIFSTTLTLTDASADRYRLSRRRRRRWLRDSSYQSRDHDVTSVSSLLTYLLTETSPTEEPDPW